MKEGQERGEGGMRERRGTDGQRGWKSVVGRREVKVETQQKRERGGEEGGRERGREGDTSLLYLVCTVSDSGQILVLSDVPLLMFVDLVSVTFIVNRLDRLLPGPIWTIREDGEREREKLVSVCEKTTNREWDGTV